MYSFNNIACINVHHRTWPQLLSLAGGQIDAAKKLSGEALGRRIFRDASDLHADPYERADVTSNTYYDWFISQPYIVFAAQARYSEIPGYIQGIPATATSGFVQHRPGGGCDEEGFGQHELSCINGRWNSRVTKR
jgi:hypothetical protein